MAQKTKKYYAYRLASGAQGVCDDWKDCEGLVTGKNARYRGFTSHSEAEEWLNAGAMYEIKASGAGKSMKPKVPILPGIYFDAGTGRGNGVEISVTDEKGENLLHKAMSKSKINKHGKHLLGKDFTNNYGELMACEKALNIAIKKGINRIFGDSKLVIDYWSKGIIKRKEMPVATVKLADKVAKLRKGFEQLGGEVGRISGDDNPADLGFH